MVSFLLKGLLVRMFCGLPQVREGFCVHKNIFIDKANSYLHRGTEDYIKDFSPQRSLLLI